MATKNGGGPPIGRGGRGGEADANHKAKSIKGLVAEGEFTHKDIINKRLAVDKENGAKNKYERKLDKVEITKEPKKEEKNKDKGKDEPEK